VDGSHIRTLLLTFFYRYFEDLVKDGHIYIAQPPLYRLQKGKDIRYAYTEKDKEAILGEMLKKVESPKLKVENKEKDIDKKEGQEIQEEDGEEKIQGISIQRYKGLGEMNPEQLWETTMDPATRVMLRVDIEDAARADKTFDVLMGNDVEPRRRFIQTHAKNVQNLDV
jgi:DNA gyrase subunit B